VTAGRARGIPIEQSPVARGCGFALVAVFALVGLAVIVSFVFASCGSGSAPLPPEPSPSATSSPSYTRTPVTFPPVLDEVLRRAWNEGRHGCGITGPAVDDLAAAIERDIGEAPPLDARIVASQWVAERCRGR